MGIEETLQRKAQERAQRQADEERKAKEAENERARQEEERRSKEAEEQASREKIREEAEYAPLRARIADLTTHAQALQSTLDRIVGHYTSAAGATTEFKNAKKPIASLVEQHKDVLAEEGISSIPEFVHAQDYKDDPKAQEYVTAGTNLMDRGRDIVATRDELRELAPDIRPKAGKQGRESTKREVESRIKELHKDIEELKKQTPEGKRAMLERALVSMEERFSPENSASRYSHGVPTLENMSSYGTLVENKDLRTAEELGEATTKRALIHTINGKIDELYKTKRGFLIDNLDADLDALENLPNDYSEVVQEAHGALEKYNECVRQCEQLIKGSTELHDRLYKYSHAGGSANKMAEDYVSHIIALMLGESAYAGDKPITDKLYAIIKGKENPNQSFKSVLNKKIALGSLDSVYARDDYNRNPNGVVRTDLPNPAYLSSDIARIQEAITRFSAFAQEHTDEIPLMTGHAITELAPPKLSDKRDGMPFEENLYIRNSTRAVIGRELNDLAELREMVTKVNKSLEAESRTLKLVIPFKIDADWSREALRNFLEKDAATVSPSPTRIWYEQRKEREQKERIPAGRPLLQLAFTDLAALRGNKVTAWYNRNNEDLSFSPADTTKELVAKIRELETNLTTKKSLLAQKNRALAEKENSWVSLGKGALKTEIATLTSEKEVLEQDIAEKEATYKALGEQDALIRTTLNKLIRVADPNDGVEDKIVDGQVYTVAWLLDHIDNQWNTLEARSPDPEKERIANEYNTLHTTNEAMIEKYKTAIKDPKALARSPENLTRAQLE